MSTLRREGAANIFRIIAPTTVAYKGQRSLQCGDLQKNFRFIAVMCQKMDSIREALNGADAGADGVPTYALGVRSRRCLRHGRCMGLAYDGRHLRNAESEHVCALVLIQHEGVKACYVRLP